MAGVQQDLVFREYYATAEDDAACKQLEVSASQFQYANGLFRAALVHYQRFNSKARQYKSGHLVLLCCLPEGDFTVGVVVVAYKQAFVHGRERKVGYVNDLRVDERCQGRGIGKALQLEVQSRAAAAGCEYLYLSVNAENKKARRLYTSLNWTAASPRQLSVTPLLFPARVPPADAAAAARAGGARYVDKEAALELTARYYSARDLGLAKSEWSMIFGSPLYLGTFSCAAADGSVAALSLWNGSSFTGFQLVHALLPLRVWATAFPVLVAAAVAALASLALKHGFVSFTQLIPTIPRSRADLPELTLHRAVVGVAAAAAFLAVSFVYNWATTRTHARARAFAPVGQGPNWQPLMRAVRAKVAASARERGYAVLFVNEDARSPFLPTLVGEKGAARRGGEGGGHAPTTFWQKRLQQPGSELAENLPLLGGDGCFDPRDF
jgi:GNAT superfamily N-acetyltransferase